MAKYDFGKIEKKWQKRWREDGLYEPDLKSAKRPFYNLMMFPYPSAEGLHVGNMYAFTGADIYGRMKRMEGYDVFQPIGLDGFGIHSENYALKIGAHPMEQSKISEKRFYKQLEEIGNGFAWDERLETYDPGYYKWTQWIFVQLFKRGLAYRAKAPVNWCPSCKTVLADEQVILRAVKNDPEQMRGIGVCERCETPVIKKELEQWFFRITKYAEELLENLEKIDWSERVKIAQRNWIGKSEGAEIDFRIIENIYTKKVVIIHGSPWKKESLKEKKYLKNWIPWLTAELKKGGLEVCVPEFPNPVVVDYEKWATEMNKVSVDNNTTIVAHSAGGQFILSWLTKNRKKINKLILVAPSGVNIQSLRRNRIGDFTVDSSVKNKADRITVFISDNDREQSIKDANYYIEFFSARKVFLPARGHFTERGMSSNEFPELLQEIIPHIRVFTTRPDTLFGATFMVVSPELARDWTNAGWSAPEEVKKYIARTLQNRGEEQKDKTGVFSGIYAINPATKKEIPVWVSDYVLAGYGTGAIMAVPAHDERDFEFAKKFRLPIVKVIEPPRIVPESVPGQAVPDTKIVSDCWAGEGELVNSGKFDGMDSEKARAAITKFVGGKTETRYRLRDWLISRQRYWGVPIPMIYCPACAKASAGKDSAGWQPVREEDLPIKLPFIKDFKPKGKDKSPLATVPEFYETKCPKCGGKARRETDVSDTFLDSAWYYIGYLAVAANSKSQIPNSKQITSPFSNPLTKKWLPVNLYTGGAEHSVLHLLYVRFLALALHDEKLLEFGTSEAPTPVGEPFPKFRAHGLLIKEGAKMSKSKGNIVNPDEYIERFGADTLRMYLMFLAPFEQGGDFRDAGILGISRFLERVWKLCGNVNPRIHANDANNKNLERVLHRTIKKVTEDVENLHYNTAISALMILLSAMEEDKNSLLVSHNSLFLKLLAPFAPHITEELWSDLMSDSDRGRRSSIHLEPWPKYDPRLVEEKTFELVVQVNGKVRATVSARKGLSQKEAEKLALGADKISALFGGRKPKKVVFVPDRLINFVI